MTQLKIAPPIDYRAIAEGRLLEIMDLEAKVLALQTAVKKVIADCENPDIRRAHTNIQMQKFLEETRTTLMDTGMLWRVKVTEWDGTEGQALDDQSDYGAAEDYADQRGQEMLDLYSKAKSTKVGQVMSCPACGKGTVKTTYNKVFCSNGRNTKGRSSCKDYYWNTINPRGLAEPEDF